MTLSSVALPIEGVVVPLMGLSGENLILILFGTSTDDGGDGFVAPLLGDVVLATPLLNSS